MGTIAENYWRVRDHYYKLKYAPWQFMMRITAGNEVYEFIVVEFSPFKLRGRKYSSKGVDINDARGMLHLIQNVGEANMLSIMKATDIATPMLSNAFLSRKTLESVELYAKRKVPGAQTFGTALSKGVAAAIKQGVVMSGVSIPDMDARARPSMPAINVLGGDTPNLGNGIPNQVDLVTFKSSSAKLVGI